MKLKVTAYDRDDNILDSILLDREDSVQVDGFVENWSNARECGRILQVAYGYEETLWEDEGD